MPATVESYREVGPVLDILHELIHSAPGISALYGYITLMLPTGSTTRHNERYYLTSRYWCYYYPTRELACFTYERW